MCVSHELVTMNYTDYEYQIKTSALFDAPMMSTKDTICDLFSRMASIIRTHVAQGKCIIVYATTNSLKKPVSFSGKIEKNVNEYTTSYTETCSDLSTIIEYGIEFIHSFFDYEGK